jgi:hypothetical protein
MTKTERRKPRRDNRKNRKQKRSRRRGESLPLRTKVRLNIFRLAILSDLRVRRKRRNLRKRRQDNNKKRQGRNNTEQRLILRRAKSYWEKKSNAYIIDQLSLHGVRIDPSLNHRQKGRD